MPDVYRTLITVEVFSDSPLIDMPLDQVHYAIDEGDCIGDVEFGVSELVPPADVHDHMVRIGNDGTFFEQLADS